MEQNNFKNGSGYFSEVSIALRRDGYDISATEDGLLTVSMGGLPLCQISNNGSVRYRDADIGCAEREYALHQVTQEVETVSEYMRLMDAAPLLKAQGLDEDYRQLADFNGYVLAGHPTRYSVQFVTWQWSYCYTRGGEITGGYGQNYGYIMEMPNYRYCLRCNPQRGDYNAYLTCFDLQVQRQKEEPAVGKISFASGEEITYNDPAEYLKAIRKELPYRNTSGFRYQTLTDPRRLQ